MMSNQDKIEGDCRNLETYVKRIGPKVVELPQQSGRIILIGDVHGCYVEIVDLLHKCQYEEPKDCVILVGDLVNKGPHPQEVVSLARKLKFWSVKGNHDDMVIMHWDKRQDCIVKGLDPNLSCDPSMSWVDKLSPENIDFLRKLPFIITIPQYSSVVVHAGLIPGIDYHQQPYEAALYRMRDLVFKDNQWIPTEAFVGKPWAGYWKGPDFVFFGHDSPRRFQEWPMALGLDSACVHGFEMTACILPGRELVRVPAKKQYVPPKKEIPTTF